MTVFRTLGFLVLIVGLAGLSACAAPAPARAEMFVDVAGPGGRPASGEGLDAAAEVIGRRLTEAGIPILEVVRRDESVVVRFGAATSDSDLDAARDIAAFTSEVSFRAVLLSGVPTATESVDGAFDDPTAEPTDGSDPAWITTERRASYDAAECATWQPEHDPDPALPLVACSDDETVKYLLGPAEIDASRIDEVRADEIVSANGAATGSWAVSPEFDAEGTRDLADMTARLSSLEPPRDQFAVVLDGSVLLAPAVQAAITNGQPQISGSFTEDDARRLAGRFRLAALGISTTVARVSLLE